jgi:tetratricopeptide (TPR) repeat protein/CHAT domain-containing protein
MSKLVWHWLQIGLLTAAILAVALFPASTVAAPLQQQDDRQAQADALLFEGSDLVKAGQWEAGMEKLLAALSIYEELNDYEGAVLCLRAMAEAKGKQGRDLVESGELAAALEAFEVQRRFYFAVGQTRGVAISLLMIGFVKEQLGDLPGALEAYEASLSAYREIEIQTGEATALLSIGDVEQSLGNHQEALEAYQEAQAIYHRIGAWSGEAGALNNMGSVHLRMGDYQRALEHFQQALAIRVELGEHGLQAGTLSNIGLVYSEMGEYVLALEHLLRALAIATEVEEPLGLTGTVLNNIGSVYHHKGQYQEALEFLQLALAIRLASMDPKGLGETLINIGSVYDELGEYDQALENYQDGLAIAEEADDRYLQGEALGNLGQLLSSLGQYQQALDHHHQALSIAEEIGDRAGEATALNNIGFIYHNTGQYQQALDQQQQALEIWLEIGKPAGAGVTRNNIGAVYLDMGRHQDALNQHQQALSIAEEIGDRAGEATALNNVASVYAQLGKYGEALAAFQEALAILQDIGHRAGEGATLNNIAGVYDDLAQYERALDGYREALTIHQELGTPKLEAVALSNIAGVYGEFGEYEEALDYLEQALTIQHELGDLVGEAVILNNIGAVHREQEQYPQALEAFEQARTVFQEAGYHAGVATTLNNAAMTYGVQGEYQEALEGLQQASSIRQQIGDRPGEAEALSNIAFVYESQGDHSQAIAYYRQSIEAIESIQGQIGAEELKASFAGEQTGIYEHLINLFWEDGDLEAALEYAERARARAFLDQIGNQQVDFRVGAAPELVTQEQELRQRIIALQNGIQDERSKPLNQQSEELLDALRTDLESTRKDYQQLLTRLKLTSPEYASLVSVDTLSLEELQSQVLDEQTTLIEYFMMDDYTLAWLIDRQGFEWLQLDINGDDLRNKVRFLDNLISERDYDTQTAAELYDALFAPLKRYIRYSNLIIAPHRALHYLPFGALWDAENERFLIQDYALTFAPSASVLQFILDKRNPDEGRVLALGDPEGDLRHAAKEAKDVASLYDTSALLRDQATESQVHARAGQVDLFHLAAHGIYDRFNPLFTRIELAADDDQDGNLEVHEVFGLDLSGANLVVLSACDTALGEQSEGDELVGLTRAFLYAGSPAVVTSLWAVDDAASGVLMEAFYRHLREGQTSAEALRLAQLEVMSHEEWRTPYYWAAFNLTGDCRGSEEPRIPKEEASEPAEPAPRDTGGGPCASVALPLGLVVLAAVLAQPMRQTRAFPRVARLADSMCINRRSRRPSSPSTPLLRHGPSGGSRRGPMSRPTARRTTRPQERG